MSNRFDLEQNIIKAWGIIDDLKDVTHDKELVEVEKIKMLIDFYDWRFEQLWATFEGMVHDKKLP